MSTSTSCKLLKNRYFHRFCDFSSPLPPGTKAGRLFCCSMLLLYCFWNFKTPKISKPFFTENKKPHEHWIFQHSCGFFSSCASRSRTYDGGVKVPCLTAWRWRIMQNSIAYFPLFHKRCAAFLQLFLCAVCRTCGGLGRFLGFAAGALRFPYPSMFLRKASFAGCVFQKTQSAGGTRFILQR